MMSLTPAFREERGSALLETAITLPIFVAFVLGLINFVDLARSHQAAGIAAREAVRFGTTYEGVRGSGFEALVTQRAVAVAAAHGLDGVTVSMAQGSRGGTLRVFVTATVDLVGFRTVSFTRGAAEAGATHASLGAPP